MVSVHPNRRDETLLVVTSREKTSEEGATNTQFAVHLNNNSKTNGITAAHLNHVTVPNMFDNVREGLNTINVTVSGHPNDPDITHRLTIPAKYYATVDEIHTAVNNAATDAGVSLTMSTQGSDHTFWTHIGDRISREANPIDFSAKIQWVNDRENGAPFTIAGFHPPGVTESPVCNMFLTVKESVTLTGGAMVSYGPDFALTGAQIGRKCILKVIRFEQYPHPDWTDESLWPNAIDLYNYNWGLVDPSAHPPGNPPTSTRTLEEYKRENNVSYWRSISGPLVLAPGNYTTSTDFRVRFGDTDAALDLKKDAVRQSSLKFTGVNNNYIQTEYPDDGSGTMVAIPGVRIMDSSLIDLSFAGDLSTLIQLVYVVPQWQSTTDHGFTNIHISSPTAGEEGDLLTGVLGIQSGVGPGLTDPNTGAAAGVGHSPHNLNGPSAVLLCSIMLADGNAIGVGDGSGTKLEHPVIDLIPMNVPRGSFAWYQPNEVASNLLRYKHRKQLSRVDFRITDTHGRPLHLPANYHVTLVMRLIHESLDGV
jgi:hypothetical protein